MLQNDVEVNQINIFNNPSHVAEMFSRHHIKCRLRSDLMGDDVDSTELSYLVKEKNNLNNKNTVSLVCYIIFS